MDKQTLGKLIKEKRKEKKITQKQLALQLHVTETAVSKWERGINYPDIENLEPLSVALGIPVSSLLGSQLTMAEEGAEPDNPPAEGCDTASETDTTPEANTAQKMDTAPETDTASEINTTPKTDTAPETENAPADEIPDREDSDTGSQKPEQALPGWFFQKKTALLKTAVLLFCIIVLGKTLFVLHAQTNTSEEPSFTITDEYYDNYNGQKAYFLIVEYTGEPTDECLLQNDETLRDTYSKYLEECGMLLAFYLKSGTDRKGIDLENSADYYSIFYPYPSQ